MALVPCLDLAAMFVMQGVKDCFHFIYQFSGQVYLSTDLTCRGLMVIASSAMSGYSQSASPIQHTVNLVFGYKVFLKVYFNVKIHADFKSVCSQTQNVERFAKSMF